MRTSNGESVFVGGKSMSHFSSNTSEGVDRMDIRCLQCLSFISPKKENIRSKIDSKAFMTTQKNIKQQGKEHKMLTSNLISYREMDNTSAEFNLQKLKYF